MSFTWKPNLENANLNQWLNCSRGENSIQTMARVLSVARPWYMLYLFLKIIIMSLILSKKNELHYINSRYIECKPLKLAAGLLLSLRPRAAELCRSLLWAKCDLKAEVAYWSNKNLDLYQHFSHRSKVSGWPIQGWKGSPGLFIPGLLSGSARSANAVCFAAYLLLSAFPV